ncbi:MAG: hypothetical protein ABR555_12720 [Pyrinomonadaceae bacterium]
MKKAPVLTLVVWLACLVAAAQQDTSSWVFFESPEGRFNIMLPAKPTTNIKTVDSAVGKLSLHYYTSVNNVGSFLFSYGDYPTAPAEEEQRQNVLDGVRGGVLQVMQTKLVSETKISLRGYPGREFISTATIDGVDMIFRWKILLVGTRLYQLGVATSKDNADAPDVDKFLTSFQLSN